MSQTIVSATVRTPPGRFGDAQAGVRPDDLASTAITGVLVLAPALENAPANGCRL